MSLPADIFIVPAVALSNPRYINACTAVNITSNSAAQSAMKICCGSAPIKVIMDGCYSYCNVTSSADQKTFKKCFRSSAGIKSDVDYACTLDDNPLTAILIPRTGVDSYLGGSNGAFVFASATDSSAATASSTATVTATASSGKATSHAPTSTSASATASSNTNAGQPRVKQFSKGAVAVLAIFIFFWFECKQLQKGLQTGKKITLSWWSTTGAIWEQLHSVFGSGFMSIDFSVEFTFF
ncbi:hypothetical protein DSL72_001900 [Monilinia vaccinii-corymbosi]|uniref:Uncharacterized protein n=1 Tax=Monilinia vaccinii-corymbosi TaxID=61207 RepID=A0A8A3PB41_9HELO|nr:hypothetical protein DSL72_001900 [Monilinia vaccinii-corymbosi]